MKIKTLEDLLVREIQELYDAEQRLSKALPKMIKAANSPNLRGALEEQLATAQTHVGRLEQAFTAVGKPVKSETSKALKGLIDEGETVVDDSVDPAVKDAGLIMAAQKVEHYEMAAYGSLRSWADLLGLDRVSEMFQHSLEEEREADKKLTSIATDINAEAKQHMLR